MNSYLEQFRQRLIAHFTYMKSDIYRETIKKQLDNEMELNKILKSKVHCLEYNIKTLLEEAIHLLKVHTNELGIENLERPIQLITYANDISNKHKDLRSKIVLLENEIGEYNYENEKMNRILNSVQSNGNQLLSIEHSLNNNQYSTLLPENSINLAFISDTYHHFEYPKSTLASIHQALKEKGQLVIIDYRKIKGKSSNKKSTQF